MQQDGLQTMAKKAKKRGVKPGTKRGPYKKGKNKPIAFKVEQQLRETEARLAKLAPLGPAYAPGPLTLCGQLEDSIMLLEQRISNAITKINSLM